MYEKKPYTVKMLFAHIMVQYSYSIYLLELTTHANHPNIGPFGPNCLYDIEMILSSVLNVQKIDSYRAHVFHVMLSNILVIGC